MSVKDVKLKPIPVDLGGKKRTIFYDWNAFAELEEKYESLDIMFERLKKPTMKDLQVLLWAGLLHTFDDPQDGIYMEGEKPFTPRYVGKLMHGISDMSKLNIAIFSAISDAMPKPGESQAVAETAKKND